jgi:hypothetical protein
MAASVTGCPCWIGNSGKRPSFMFRVLRPHGTPGRFVTGAIGAVNCTEAIQFENATYKLSAAV